MGQSLVVLYNIAGSYDKYFVRCQGAQVCAVLV